MKLNEEFMQNAIARINELQKEIKEQSKNIEGAQKYIDQQVELYKQDEALRNEFKSIQEKTQKVANDFFKNHSQVIEETKKNMVSMQKEAKKLQEKYDTHIPTE